jgi:hypothetical protein
LRSGGLREMTAGLRRFVFLFAVTIFDVNMRRRHLG